MRCHLTRDLEEGGTKGVFGNEDCDGKIFQKIKMVSWCKSGSAYCIPIWKKEMFGVFSWEKAKFRHSTDMEQKFWNGKFEISFLDMTNEVYYR